MVERVAKKQRLKVYKIFFVLMFSSILSFASQTNQLIEVKSRGGSNAWLVAYERDDNGAWIEVFKTKAILGKNGITQNKKEGDGATPLGLFELKSGFGISQVDTLLPYRVLDGSEHWVDDVNSAHYNTLQTTKSDWSSSEHLISEDLAYRYVVVVEYNTEPIVSGLGSAIFIHVHKGKPTAGCVAVSEDVMVKILKWLNPAKNPKIIIK